ncbi:MAG TPA: pilus assembly protein TadG-related protein [Anaerolineales bacterium]
MKRYRRSERGQALVLVMLAMIALIGIAGLAIDGGNGYSDRRHAQNAADTSAMAAALASVRNAGNWTAARDEGLARASANGYDNNGTSNLVEIYPCNDVNATCNLPAGEVPQEFVQVRITSTIPTYLGRVVGMPTLTNKVEAIAQAVPPVPVPWYNGNALVALMPHCKPQGWPSEPFDVSGSSATLITGAGGVFVNSDCDGAFTASYGSSFDSVSGICVVGTSDVQAGAHVNPLPTDNCGTAIPEDFYRAPAVDDSSCPVAGQFYDLGGGSYVASPGYFNSPFPNLSPAGVLKLQKGIYCLNNGLSLSAGWVMTTDIDGNGTFDGSDGADEGVLFYVPHGNVTFNGSSFVEIGAINKSGTDVGIKGYLIYLPPTNNSTVKLAGGNGSTFIGTVLAPASLITLEGGSSGDHLNLEVQIIGYSINVTGGGVLDVEYNEGTGATTYTNPELILYK